MFISYMFVLTYFLLFALLDSDSCTKEGQMDGGRWTVDGGVWCRRSSTLSSLLFVNSFLVLDQGDKVIHDVIIQTPFPNSKCPVETGDG